MSQDDGMVSKSCAPIFTYADGEKEWEAPHGEEMELKLDEGSSALLDKFGVYGINDLVEIDRPNVAA